MNDDRMSTDRWITPYVDQPMDFWERLNDQFGPDVAEVYLPLPQDILGSGRPPQSHEHTPDFLAHGPFPVSILVNPITLPRPASTMVDAICSTIGSLHDKFGLAGLTLAQPLLAEPIKERFPDIPLTASVLMDISRPLQISMLNDLFDVLVPSNRIMRDLPALRSIKDAFDGRIRLLVNEACLPGCPFRIQHFHEMGSGWPDPESLCRDLLEQQPWLRLTGAWVLPQHLHLFEGIYDELKLAGRVTLQAPEKYARVLGAYIRRKTLFPFEIGGGPASILDAFPIDEAFYRHTLFCGHQCHTCNACRNYYQEHAISSGGRNHDR